MYMVEGLPRVLPIQIGYQTETGANSIYFNCATWLKAYPGINLSVWVTPPGGADAYQAQSHLEGSLLVWDVTASDTLTAGEGRLEIFGTLDGVRKLSAVCRTEVKPSLLTSTTEPPESQQPWYATAVEAADRAEKAAERAETMGGVTPEQIKTAVDNYMDENPIQFDETDPTVPNWAKQPNKPRYTADEVGAQPKGDYALRSEIPTMPDPYTLPVASADTLGGVKVGEGLQMDGDVLGVKPEGVYELIETITLEEDMALERTQEPDGTPYNFSAMLIRIFKPANVTFSANISTAATTSDESEIQLYIPASANTNTEQYFVVEIKPEKGYYDVSRYQWNLITAPNQCYTVKADALNHNVNKRGNIVRYHSRSTALKAGCTYEIWGVRSNA